MYSTTVLIIGAGPVGLVTALGLRRAGVQEVTVVDQGKSLDERKRWSKAFSLSAGTLETLRTMGLEEEFVSSGIAVNFNHFGANPTLLKFGPELLGLKHSFNLLIPQADTERKLYERCKEYGIRFVWESRFVGLQQQPDKVIARFKPSLEENGARGTVEELLESSWLVGCDGTRGAVRVATGITTRDSALETYGWFVEGHVSPGTPNYMSGVGPEGLVMLLAAGDGAHRIMGMHRPRNGQTTRVNQDPSEEDARQAARQVFGKDFGFHAARWSSAFGDKSRLADTYRADRVFLAGDAAHQFFPAGGQGMNLGVQDAINLVWKLGLVATGSISDSDIIERLLDSYTEERRPAAQAVIENVHVQCQLLVASTEQERSLREFAAEVLRNEEMNRKFALRVTGFGEPTEAYRKPTNVEEGSLLVGTRVTHLGEMNVDSITKATNGKSLSLLLFKKGNPLTRQRLHTVASGWIQHVTVVEEEVWTAHEKWCDVNAVLVRPDLRIAWAGKEDLDVSLLEKSLSACLEWWLGEQGGKSDAGSG